MPRLSGSNVPFDNLSVPQLSQNADANYQRVIQNSMNNFDAASQALANVGKMNAMKHQADLTKQANIEQAQQTASARGGSGVLGGIAEIGKALSTAYYAKQQLQADREKAALDLHYRERKMQLDEAKFDFDQKKYVIGVKNAQESERQDTIMELLEGNISALEAELEANIIETNTNAGLESVMAKINTIRESDHYKSLDPIKQAKLERRFQEMLSKAYVQSAKAGQKVNEEVTTSQVVQLSNQFQYETTMLTSTFSNNKAALTKTELDSFQENFFGSLYGYVNNEDYKHLFSDPKHRAFFISNGFALATDALKGRTEHEAGTISNFNQMLSEINQIETAFANPHPDQPPMSPEHRDQLIEAKLVEYGYSPDWYRKSSFSETGRTQRQIEDSELKIKYRQTVQTNQQLRDSVGFGDNDQLNIEKRYIAQAVYLGLSPEADRVAAIAKLQREIDLDPLNEMAPAKKAVIEHLQSFPAEQRAYRARREDRERLSAEILEKTYVSAWEYDKEQGQTPEMFEENGQIYMRNPKDRTVKAISREDLIERVPPEWYDVMVRRMSEIQNDLTAYERRWAAIGINIENEADDKHLTHIQKITQESYEKQERLLELQEQGSSQKLHDEAVEEVQSNKPVSVAPPADRPIVKTFGETEAIRKEVINSVRYDVFNNKNAPPVFTKSEAHTTVAERILEGYEDRPITAGWKDPNTNNGYEDLKRRSIKLFSEFIGEQDVVEMLEYIDGKAKWYYERKYGITTSDNKPQTQTQPQTRTTPTQNNNTRIINDLFYELNNAQTFSSLKDDDKELLRKALQGKDLSNQEQLYNAMSEWNTARMMAGYPATVNDPIANNILNKLKYYSEVVTGKSAGGSGTSNTATGSRPTENTTRQAPVDNSKPLVKTGSIKPKDTFVIIQGLGLAPFKKGDIDKQSITHTRGMAGAHKGIDWGAYQGTEVLSLRGGKVISVHRGCQVGDTQCNGRFGDMVVIETHDGYKEQYAHAHEIFVEEGDYVQAGQVIMSVGNTGLSTGNHLHFGVYQGAGKSWPTGGQGYVKAEEYIQNNVTNQSEIPLMIPSSGSEDQQANVVLPTGLYWTSRGTLYNGTIEFDNMGRTISTNPDRSKLGTLTPVSGSRPSTPVQSSQPRTQTTRPSSVVTSDSRGTQYQSPPVEALQEDIFLFVHPFGTEGKFYVEGWQNINGEHRRMFQKVMYGQLQGGVSREVSYAGSGNIMLGSSKLNIINPSDSAAVNNFFVGKRPSAAFVVGGATNIEAPSTNLGKPANLSGGLSINRRDYTSSGLWDGDLGIDFLKRHAGFRAKFHEICKRLNIPSVWLADIIGYESAGFTDPNKPNSWGYKGLIQFHSMWYDGRLGLRANDIFGNTEDKWINQLELIARMFESIQKEVGISSWSSIEQVAIAVWGGGGQLRRYQSNPSGFDVRDRYNKSVNWRRYREGVNGFARQRGRYYRFMNFNLSSNIHTQPCGCPICNQMVASNTFEPHYA